MKRNNSNHGVPTLGRRGKPSLQSVTNKEAQVRIFISSFILFIFTKSSFTMSADNKPSGLDRWLDDPYMRKNLVAVQNDDNWEWIQRSDATPNQVADFLALLPDPSPPSPSPPASPDSIQTKRKKRAGGRIKPNGPKLLSRVINYKNKTQGDSDSEFNPGSSVATSESEDYADHPSDDDFGSLQRKKASPLKPPSPKRRLEKKKKATPAPSPPSKKKLSFLAHSDDDDDELFEEVERFDFSESTAVGTQKRKNQGTTALEPTEKRTRTDEAEEEEPTGMAVAIVQYLSKEGFYGLDKNPVTGQDYLLDAVRTLELIADVNKIRISKDPAVAAFVRKLRQAAQEGGGVAGWKPDSKDKLFHKGIVSLALMAPVAPKGYADTFQSYPKYSQLRECVKDNNPVQWKFHILLRNYVLSKLSTDLQQLSKIVNDGEGQPKEFRRGVLEDRKHTGVWSLEWFGSQDPNVLLEKWHDVGVIIRGFPLEYCLLVDRLVPGFREKVLAIPRKNWLTTEEEYNNGFSCNAGKHFYISVAPLVPKPDHEDE